MVHGAEQDSRGSPAVPIISFLPVPWSWFLLELLSKRDREATPHSPCTHLPTAFCWWAPDAAFVPRISQQALCVLTDQQVILGMPLVRGTSAVAAGNKWIVSPILSFLRKGFTVPGQKAELRAQPAAPTPMFFLLVVPKKRQQLMSFHPDISFVMHAVVHHQERVWISQGCFYVS